MTPKNIFRLAAVLPLGASLLVGGAALAREKPEAQLATAHAALDEARRSYAVQYAPVDFDAARTKLEAADAAAQKRDYDEARRLAAEAEADAKLADVRARVAVAEQSVAQVQQGMGAMQGGLQPDPAAAMPPAQ